METRANLITVGLFLFAVIIAGFGGAYWLLNGTKTGPRSVIAVNFQGSVGGLSTGANVSFNGIKIGEVTSLAFAPGDANRVIAYLSVDSNAPLKVDSKAALGFTGLTGYASVQITGGSNEAKPLIGSREGMPELTADVSSVQDLVEGAKRLMGRVDQTMTTVQQLVEQNGPSVARTIHNAETFSDSLAKNSGNVDKFMASVGQAADVLTKVSGKIETLSDDVDGLVKAVDKGKIGKIVDDVARVSGNLATTSDKLAGAIDEARSTIADARKVIAAVDPQKVGGAVDDLAKVTRELAQSSDRISGILADTQGTMSDARKLLAAVDSAKVGRVIDNASKISDDLAKSSGDVSGLVQDARVAMGGLKDLSVNANLALTDARKLVAAVDPAKVAAAVDDVSKLTRKLGDNAQSIDEVVAHARTASANIDAFTADLTKKSPDVGHIIDDTAAMMKKLSAASDRVDGILARVDGLVGSDQGQGLFQQGRTFLTEATEAARAFKEMSQTFASKGDEISAALNRFTSQGLREVQGFVADSRKTMGTIDRAVSELDRNPQRLIFGTNRGNVPEYGPGRR